MQGISRMWIKMGISKKGKMEWEYLAAIVLVLLIIVVMILYSGNMKNLIISKGGDFWGAIQEKLFTVGE